LFLAQSLFFPFVCVPCLIVLGCGSSHDRYFVPEDGDDEHHPNVFLAPKGRNAGSIPTLLQIKDVFPLPGSYHFRFKSPLVPGGDREKANIAVWMDCTRDNQMVPTWRGTIVAKVTRVGMEDDDDDDTDFIRGGQAAPAPPQQNRAVAPPSHHVTPAPSVRPPPRAPATENLLDVFDGPSPTSHEVSAPPAAAAGGTGNLLDAHHTPAPVAVAAGSTLLDMDNHHYKKPEVNNQMHSDFLGMTAPAPLPVTPRNPMAYGGPTAPTPTQQQQQYGYPGSHPVPQSHPQQQQQPPRSAGAYNFPSQNGPFGDLGTPWK